MILRGLAIWSSVGLGHLAVLGSLWSGVPTADNAVPSLVLDLTFVAPAPSAPSSLAAPPSGNAHEVLAPALSPSRPTATVPTPRHPLPASHPPLTAPGLAATPPSFLERVEPAYPLRARRAGQDGAVTVRLRLAASGDLLAAEVVRGSGSALLDEAALIAARASRYAPARSAGHPVEAETEATYRFVLR